MEDFHRYTRYYLEKHPEEKQAIAEEHLERVAKGKKIWNNWAEEFAEFIEKKALEDAFIDLGEIEINITDHYFSELNIPCFISFFKTIFSGDIDFSHSTFSGDTDFSHSTFSDGADFSDSTFSGNAYFRDSTFSGTTFFSDSTFSGDADFSRTNFNKQGNFKNCSFEKVNDFTKSMFNNQVPDFNYASFKQAPHLASVSIPFIKEKQKGLVERYRKLKQMAQSSKDHENELVFFGYETHAKFYQVVLLVFKLRHQFC